MPDTIVTLLDQKWKVLRLPGRFRKTTEMIRTVGFYYPTWTRAECPNGHEHRTVPGRKYRTRLGPAQWPKLPDTIEPRYAGEPAYCLQCNDVHEDYGTHYWACTLCGADMGDLPVAHTGLFSFEMVTGAEPSTPMLLELTPDGHPTVTLRTDMHPHLHLGGEDLGEVLVGDWAVQAGMPLTLEVTPLREEQVGRLAGEAVDD